jgi:hypothetical protein
MWIISWLPPHNPLSMVRRWVWLAPCIKSLHDKGGQTASPVEQWQRWCEVKVRGSINLMLNVLSKSVVLVYLFLNPMRMIFWLPPCNPKSGIRADGSTKGSTGSLYQTSSWQKWLDNEFRWAVEKAVQVFVDEKTSA